MSKRLKCATEESKRLKKNSSQLSSSGEKLPPMRSQQQHTVARTQPMHQAAACEATNGRMSDDIKRGNLVAVSALSADVANSGDDIQCMLDQGVDVVHVGCCNGRFVPTFTFGAPFVCALRRRFPHVRIDVHCCVETPGEWVEWIGGAGATTFIFHYEGVNSLTEAAAILKRSRELGMRSGIALSPKTSIAVIIPLLEQLLVDTVLIITMKTDCKEVKFQAGILSKVGELREKFPANVLDIIVEGGVNAQTAPLCRLAGATTVVCGSHLFESDDVARLVNELRTVPERSSIDAWRTLPAKHVPSYEDANSVLKVEALLRQKEAIVSFEEVQKLRQRFCAVESGDAMLLIGGDCCEDMDEFKSSGGASVRDSVQMLLQAAERLSVLLKRDVLVVPRMCGQIAKSRTKSTETRNGVTLDTFWGANVNGIEFDTQARPPNANCMLTGYDFSISALAELKRSAEEHITANNSGANTLCGGFERGSFENVLPISHEALLLPYEAAMTRPCVHQGVSRLYNASAHLLWVGNKTRQLDHAHVAYLRCVENPIGVKLGVDLSPTELVQLLTLLNPFNERGKIVLFARTGASELLKHLPGWIEAVHSEALHVSWCCDPMHGNTRISTCNNVKTRDVSVIVDELQQFVACLSAHSVSFGGVMLEMCGNDAVSECVGEGVDETQLSVCYKTLCDPRLNRLQTQAVLDTLRDTLHKHA